jgi:hypothetical protein
LRLVLQQEFVALERAIQFVFDACALLQLGLYLMVEEFDLS